MNRFESSFKLLMWCAVILLAAFVVGCGGGGGGGDGAASSGASVLPGAAGAAGAAATDPTVGSASPSNGATNVATSTNGPGNVVTGKILTATFSQAMNPLTVTPVGTFTLRVTNGVDVPGTVTMNAANTIATFTPTAVALLPNTNYTATVSTVARNTGGTAMPSPVSWSFTTASTPTIGQAPVNLGMAGNFTILTKTGITASGAAGTLVTGDMGVSPGFATTITGFALVADPTNVFSTSTLVTGRIFAADYAPPTPANLTTAVSNMETAFTDAAGRPAGVGPNLNLLGGILTPSQTLAPGVYTWNTPGGVSISTNLTLSGSADDVWIFQITGTLDLETNVQILLAGGAQAKNIFWQVSDTVTLKPNSHFEGVILAQTLIAMQTSATANARFLAQTAATLQGNPVTPPAP